MATLPPRRGALVISLDFELDWGVRDTLSANGGYRENLLGARQVVPKLLALFERYEIAATWATVGFLFAPTREALLAASPEVKPQYHDPRLDPYRAVIGDDEQSDPLHYAASLIDLIVAQPRQELATHTFSHYYCLEPGQTKEAFQADLAAAVKVAAARGVRVRSIVLPRNQLDPAYLELLKAFGINCYRGTEPSRLYRPAAGAKQSRPRRALRLLDSYLNLTGANLVRWEAVREENGLCNVASSRFLRPYNPKLRGLEPLRLRRVVKAMEAAAKQGAIYHLWWHPHNFGAHQELNLTFLARLLEAFAGLRERYGMESLSMAEVCDRVRVSAR